MQGLKKIIADKSPAAWQNPGTHVLAILSCHHEPGKWKNATFNQKPFFKGCEKLSQGWEHLVTYHIYLATPNNSHYEEKEKLYIILTGWPKLIAWLPLLHRILGNKYNVIIYCPACDKNWANPEKKQGGWGHTFLKTLLEFFGFLLQSWKLQIKQSSTLTTPQ